MKTEVDIKIAGLHQKAKALMSQELEEKDIIGELQKEGIDAGYATIILENVRADKRDRIDAWKLTLMGSFFIIGGLCINYFSYLTAVNYNAGGFYIFWGIVVAGVLMLMRAAFLFRRL